MIKKVLYGLAIGIVLTGMVVMAADSTSSDTTKVDTTTIVFAEDEVASIQSNEASGNQVNQLLIEKKRFEFNLVSLLRGLLGMLVLIGIAFLFSSNRKAVAWKVVGIGLGIQILLAIAILQFPPVQIFFEIGRASCRERV